MKKSMKKMMLLALSSSVMLGMQLPVAVGAQEETSETTQEETTETETETPEIETEPASEEENESASAESETPREQGEQPYTEAEIVEFIKPAIEYDLNRVQTIEEINETYDILVEAIAEDSVHLDYERIIDLVGEPNTESQTGNSYFLTYVGIEDDEVVVLELQTYDNENGNGDVLSNLTRENRTPKMFQSLAMVEEQLAGLLTSDDIIKELRELVGVEEKITIYPDVYEGGAPRMVHTWGVVGNENIPADEVALIEVEVNDGEFTATNYALQSDLQEAGSESADEAETTEESDIETETTEEETE